MSMSPTEQRIALAEFVGWKKVHYEKSWCSEDQEYHTFDKWEHPTSLEDEPPYRPSDLNAVHKVEKKVPHLPYLYRLQETVGGRMETSGDLARIIRATAAQRCEALCRVLWPERWKEGA